jgi:hypothetical protein
VCEVPDGAVNSHHRCLGDTHLSGKTYEFAAATRIAVTGSEPSALPPLSLTTHGSNSFLSHILENLMTHPSLRLLRYPVQRVGDTVAWKNETVWELLGRRPLETSTRLVRFGSRTRDLQVRG